MIDSLTFRLSGPNDITAIYALLSDVFHADIAPHYSSEGQEEFLRHVAPEALQARSERNHFALLAVLKDEIVGVVEIQDHCHLSLLFVSNPYQDQGIAKELLRQGVGLCLKHRVDVLTLTVHASPNAVRIYEKLGFCVLQPEQVSHGIRFTLMELNLLDCEFLNSSSATL